MDRGAEEWNCRVGRRGIVVAGWTIQWREEEAEVSKGRVALVTVRTAAGLAVAARATPDRSAGAILYILDVEGSAILLL